MAVKLHQLSASQTHTDNLSWELGSTGRKDCIM